MVHAANVAALLWQAPKEDQGDCVAQGRGLFEMGTTVAMLAEQDGPRLRADAERINAEYEQTLEELRNQGWWTDQNGEWHAPREERPSRPLTPDDGQHGLRARGTEPNPPNPLRGGLPGQEATPPAAPAAHAAQAPQEPHGWRQVVGNAAVPAAAIVGAAWVVAHAVARALESNRRR